MMVKVPDVTIGEHRKASKQMLAVGHSNDADDFAVFKVNAVSFNWDKKKFVVHIRSMSNNGCSAGVDADVIETCEVVR